MKWREHCNPLSSMDPPTQTQPSYSTHSPPPQSSIHQHMQSIHHPHPSSSPPEDNPSSPLPNTCCNLSMVPNDHPALPPMAYTPTFLPHPNDQTWDSKSQPCQFHKGPIHNHKYKIHQVSIVE